MWKKKDQPNKLNGKPVTPSNLLPSVKAELSDYEEEVPKKEYSKHIKDEKNPDEIIKEAMKEVKKEVPIEKIMADLCPGLMDNRLGSLEQDLEKYFEQIDNLFRDYGSECFDDYNLRLKKRRREEGKLNDEDDKEEEQNDDFFRQEMQRLAKRMNLRDSTVNELMKAFSNNDKQPQKQKKSTAIYGSQERNSQRIKTIRAETVLTLIDFLQNKKWRMIAIDETGFMSGMARRTGGWSLRGQPIVAPVRPTGPRIDIAVCAAMDHDHLIAQQIREGHYDDVSFFAFMRRLIEILDEDDPNFRDNSFILLDNYRVHKTETITRWLANMNVHVLQTAPFSPVLNPVEHVFAKWKNPIRQKVIDTKEDLIDAIVEYSPKVTPEECRKYFVHTFRYYKPALLFEDLVVKF